jgi:hypothetical protein
LPMLSPAVGRDFVEQDGMTDRVNFLEGNALKTDFPGEKDAVLMSCAHCSPQIVFGSSSAKDIVDVRGFSSDHRCCFEQISAARSVATTCRGSTAKPWGR